MDLKRKKNVYTPWLSSSPPSPIPLFLKGGGGGGGVEEENTNGEIKSAQLWSERRYFNPHLLCWPLSLKWLTVIYGQFLIHYSRSLTVTLAALKCARSYYAAIKLSLEVYGERDPRAPTVSERPGHWMCFVHSFVAGSHAAHKILRTTFDPGSVSSTIHGLEVMWLCYCYCD